jgi:hypothetical protein
MTVFADTNFLLAVSRGERAGWSYLRKFGYNPDVAMGSWEDVWTTGGAMYWPSAADELRVVSGSGDDAADGSGLRSILLEGKDASIDDISELKAMNGTGNADTTAAFFRLDRAVGVGLGGSYRTSLLTGAANAGVITVTHIDGSGTMATIPVDHGRSQLARYTVPAGYTAYVRVIHAHVDSTKGAILRAIVRPNCDVVEAPFSSVQQILYWPGTTLQQRAEADGWSAFPEKTDLVMQANGAAAGSVSVAIDVILREN